VVVQPDDPGDYCLAREIDGTCARRYLHRGRWANRRDLLAANDDRLSVLDGRTRPVNDAGVGERHDGLVDGDVRLERRSELPALGTERCSEENGRTK